MGRKRTDNYIRVRHGLRLRLSGIIYLSISISISIGNLVLLRYLRDRDINIILVQRLYIRLRLLLRLSLSLSLLMLILQRSICCLQTRISFDRIIRRINVHILRRLQRRWRSCSNLSRKCRLWLLIIIDRCRCVDLV